MNIPISITNEGLFAKSCVYIQRGFRAKEADDLDEYQLWLSLALELLGKAALAKIHPCLVVDPGHSDSLFAAAGKAVGSDIKTIGAGTLYKRLGNLSKYFDASVKDFCDAISLRRNAELHSGELPFHQMRVEAWEGRYWHAAQIILTTMNSTLEEWLGADNARAPRQVLQAASAALRDAAILRVEQAKEHFMLLPRKQREALLEQSHMKSAYHFKGLFNVISDRDWAVECPACKGRAFLAGITFAEEVLDATPDDEAWEEQVEKSYGAEEFRCPTCDLRLNSREEIEAADLDPDMVEVDSRVREFEPDYGNC